MKTAIYFDHESTHCRVCDALHGEGACLKRRGQHDVLVNLPGIVKFVGKHIGPVAVAKAYSDWTYFKNYVPDLNRSLIELVHVPYVSGTKNAADMRLLLDAYADTANTPDISTVVIVSCDRDFSYLAVRLRRLGKTVIGVGVEGVRISQEWIQACDKFHYYPIPKKAPEEPGESEQTPKPSLVLPAPSANGTSTAIEIPLSSEVIAASNRQENDDEEDDAGKQDESDDSAETMLTVASRPGPLNRPPVPAIRFQPKPPAPNGVPRNGPALSGPTPPQSKPAPRPVPPPKPNGTPRPSGPMPGQFLRQKFPPSRPSGPPPGWNRLGPAPKPSEGDE